MQYDHFVYPWKTQLLLPVFGNTEKGSRVGKNQQSEVEENES